MAHNSSDFQFSRPFDSLNTFIKTKKHIIEMCFSFGTPIGNRTLVSAVRGRRLEPLDHEGKSLLLCDNSIISCRMQAKNVYFLKIHRFFRAATPFSKFLVCFDKKYQFGIAFYFDIL